MKRVKSLAVERMIPAACCLLAAAALIYAAVTRDRPAETRVELSSQNTSLTTAVTTAVCTTTDDTTVPAPLCRDLNAASAEDLMRVDGIGQVLAERIVAERARKNGFLRRAELLEVEGIGDGLMQRIMEEFFISNELPAVTKNTEQTTKPAATETTLTMTAGRYDLNLVTEEELLRIPGMTKQLAEGILELRNTIQYYTHLYEVLYVDGMDGSYVDDVLAEHLYVTPRE